MSLLIEKQKKLKEKENYEVGCKKLDEKITEIVGDRHDSASKLKQLNDLFDQHAGSESNLQQYAHTKIKQAVLREKIRMKQEGAAQNPVQSVFQEYESIKGTWTFGILSRGHSACDHRIANSDELKDLASFQKWCNENVASPIALHQTTQPAAPVQEQQYHDQQQDEEEKGRRGRATGKTKRSRREKAKRATRKTNSRAKEKRGRRKTKRNRNRKATAKRTS